MGQRYNVGRGDAPYLEKLILDIEFWVCRWIAAIDILGKSLGIKSMEIRSFQILGELPTNLQHWREDHH